MSVDAGMRAVARVRHVHEQDSRLGLAQALAEERACVTELESLRSSLEGSLPDISGTGTFVAFRQSCLALGTRMGPLRAEIAWRHTVAEEARARWQGDKTRLRAVEMLLERRAEERAAQKRHVEARELDDIAAIGWLRRRNAAGGRS